MADKYCPHCGVAFDTLNGKKKYCTPRCSKMAYVKRRYQNDADFNSRMRKCWGSYGMNACPKCGRLKKKALACCGQCVKVDKYIQVETLSEDKESLFSTPEGVAKVCIMSAVEAHPECSPEEIFEMMTYLLDGDESLTEADLKAIIKTMKKGDEYGSNRQQK